MKKSYFLAAAFLALSAFGLKAADVVLADFESPTPIGSLANGSTWIGSSVGLFVGTNPVTTGLNTTAQAAYAVRTSTQGSTFQAEFNVPTASYNGVKYFHIMVYRPQVSKLQLKGRQNSPVVSGNTWDDRFTAGGYYTDIVNEWVDVVFKVDFAATNLRIDKFVLALDMISASGRYTTDTNVYFDEIIVNDDPQPRGRTADYTTSTLPESFEGANSLVDKVFFGVNYYWKNGGVNNNTPTDEIVTNPAKNNVNNTEKVLKMMYRSTFSWDSWLQLVLNGGSGVNVDANNKYLHIMVRKNADAQFAITARKGGTDSGWIRTTTGNVSPDYAKANGWQDLVFEIPATSYGIVDRLSINGHTTGPGASDLPVYIDQIEFSATATPRTIFNVAKTYDFGATPINNTVNYSLPVTAGALLNGDLTISISGSTDFTTTTTTLSQSAISAGTAVINLTYKPTTLGVGNATVDIKSNGVTLAQVGLTGTGGNPNEAINVDFEGGTFYAASPANITWGDSNSSLTIVDNPTKAGLNTSNKVACGVRSATGGNAFQAEFNIEPTVINTTKYLHVMVLKPTHSVMSLNGRNNYPVSGNSWDNVYSATHLNYSTVVNEWVDVVFKIDGDGRKIDRLVIGLDNCNPATRYTTDTNIYFDKIELNTDPMPRGVSALPTKKTTFPENFEGTSYIGDATYFPYTYSWVTPDAHRNKGCAYEAVVANPLKDAVNGSEKVLKTTLNAGADWWTRLQFVLNDGAGTTVGAENKYLHVMMYKQGTGGEVKAFFIRTDNVQQEWINPSIIYAYNGWQDLVFEVPAAVYGAINKVAILPHGGSSQNIDVYFDDFEFSGSATPRTNVSTSSKNFGLDNFSIAKSNNNLILKGINIENAKISIYNMQGQEVLNLKNVNTTNFEFSNIFSKGVYVVKISNLKGEEKMCKFMN